VAAVQTGRSKLRSLARQASSNRGEQVAASDPGPGQRTESWELEANGRVLADFAKIVLHVLAALQDAFEPLGFLLFFVRAAFDTANSLDHTFSNNPGRCQVVRRQIEDVQSFAAVLLVPAPGGWHVPTNGSKNKKMRQSC